MGHTELERRILERITPGKLPGIVEDVKVKLQEHTEGKVILGGSSAKGTHLAGDHDFDFFVLFPEGTLDLSEKLERSLLACWKDVKRVPGSRDYFIIQTGEYSLEFIPVLAVRSWETAKNVTDMSPLHVTYVREKLEECQGLREDIRLSKQFCKACRVYGAESYIGGFSGYVLELLNIHYGGFRNLLEAAICWQDSAVIDPERLLKHPEREINEDKISPLILVDPVQRGRNAAAALTMKKYKQFIGCARQYLENPSEEFFTVRPLTKKEVQDKYPHSKIYSITLEPLPGKDDVQGAKCLKACEYMQKQMYLHGFHIDGMEFEFAKRAHCFFALEQENLDEEERIIGPPLDMEDHVEQFKQRHPETYDDEERIYATEQRDFTNARDLLEHLCRTQYVRARTRKVTL